MGCGSSKAKRPTALVAGEGGALVVVDVDTVKSGANVDNNTTVRTTMATTPTCKQVK
jgi:hypothetical protein